MSPTLLDAVKEWFSELSITKKVLLAIPFAIALIGVALWQFAKYASGNGKVKKDDDPSKIVIDKQLKRHDEDTEVFHKMVTAVKSEIDLIHKRGELDAKSYQELKTDLRDAGDDIDRINAVLARARERRVRRTDR